MNDTQRERRAPNARPGLTVFALALSLFIGLMIVRAKLVGFPWRAFVTWYEIPRIFGSAYYDLLVQSCVLLVVLLLLVPRRPRWRTWVARGYASWTVVSMFVAVLNYEAVGLLGVPVNYQWLYYSDFLTSFDAQQAISDTLSFRLIGSLVGASVGVLAAAWCVRAVLRRCPRPLVLGLQVVVPLAIAIYFPIAAFYLGASSTNKLLANPMYSFVSSYLTRGTTALSTFDSPAQPDDFRIASERAKSVSDKPRGEVENVIIVVLESVAASYVDSYGSEFGVTPHLASYRDRSLQFRNAYAHVPSTNKSLVTLLCSIYPWISFRSLTQDHPDARVTSISSILKRHGMRTSFFFSSDLAHQNMQSFLERHDFDIVQDYRTRKVDGPLIEYELQRGEKVTATDDASTVAAMLDWIDRERAPFFSVFWTVATHHPYFVRGEERSYDVKSRSRNRYLNAIREGDEAFGTLMSGLAARNVLDKTLVVVLGDHGEAFGEHGQMGHASNVWEENLRIPLVFIHPTMFRGEERDDLAGILDIGPTVLDLLGLPLAKTWQGRSLFSNERTGRVYFFAPYSELLFGYREGARKIVFNASTDRFRVHDLAKDPTERDDLTKREGMRSVVDKETEVAKARLASWIQYQAKLLKRLLVPEVGK